MIDSVLNMVFRCAHRRLTRPVTPVAKGAPQGDTYVACLDCGKHFSYDLKQMRVGKPIASVPAARSNGHPKLRFALWASVPIAAVIASVLKAKKR
jgi:DNA-directed RNA polymerase subunit RPC12/RpoP